MATEKNRFGQYFTRSTITDFMVSLITHPHEADVLEPSCGKGAFLTSLHKAGYSNVSAYEIDETLKTPFTFVCYKSFLSVPTSEKYDVVIGNPPYIRWKNLEQELKDELADNALWNQYFNSLCDYLFIFILKSIEHLRPGGELLFICSEYWLNTTHSQTLRNYMVSHGHITDIYHFKEAPLFEKVTASLIIFRYVKQDGAGTSINLYMYNQTGMPTAESLNRRACFTHSIIPQFRANERWLLATRDKQETLRRLEARCSYQADLFERTVHRIGDVCDIGNGMVSGLDKAFHLPDGLEMNDYERRQVVTVLKAKDLGSYTYTQTSTYMMVTDSLSEEQFEQRCPHFAHHLAPYKEALGKRYNYNRDIPYWEFVFPRNYRLFTTRCDKIFIPCKERISCKDFFRFCLAQDGIYPLQDVTGIVKKKSCKESVEYILAYLNRPEIFDWLCINGIVKGAIVEFSEAPIASIPYRPIDWRKPEEAEWHDEITREMRAYCTDRDATHLSKVNENIKRLLA